MANYFITPTFVTKDTAVFFKNNLQLIGQFDRKWNRDFDNAPGGAKIGYTVQVRLEQRWMVAEGQALQMQGILNQTVPISINHQFQIAMGWSSADDRLVVEEVQRRYTEPAGRKMANKWDSVAGKEVYKSVANSVGAPGVPLTNATLGEAISLMRNTGTPEPYIVVLDPVSTNLLAQANAGSYNPGPQVTQYYRRGEFTGPAMGVDRFFWDPNIPTHTTGNFTASTPIVSGAGQTGSTLLVSGFGTYALKQGDVFTIDGVFGVNPETYENTGRLQDFTLTADISGSSTATLPISPAIITSGPLQTVSAAPAATASLFFRGSTGTVSATMATQTSRQSLMFNPGAFAFVMVSLPDNLPGAKAKSVGDEDTNITMRWVEQYSIHTDQLPSRMDTIGGVAPVMPYFSVRMWS